jgi:hypothetical protein
MRYKERLKVSEVTIQAEFYSKCKEKGYKCILDYTHEDYCFDAIVVVNKDIVAIIEMSGLQDIECIEEQIFRTKKINASDQLRKYTVFGVPVLLCLSVREVARTLYKVGRLVDEHFFTKKQVELKKSFASQVDQLVQDFKSYFPDALTESNDLDEFKGNAAYYLTESTYDDILDTMKVVAKFDQHQLQIFYRKMNDQIRGTKISDVSKVDGFRTFTGRYVSQKQCTPFCKKG